MNTKKTIKKLRKISQSIREEIFKTRNPSEVNQTLVMAHAEITSALLLLHQYKREKETERMIEV